MYERPWCPNIASRRVKHNTNDDLMQGVVPLVVPYYRLNACKTL